MRRRRDRVVCVTVGWRASEVNEVYHRKLRARHIKPVIAPPKTAHGSGSGTSARSSARCPGCTSPAGCACASSAATNLRGTDEEPAAGSASSSSRSPRDSRYLPQRQGHYPAHKHPPATFAAPNAAPAGSPLRRSCPRSAASLPIRPRQAGSRTSGRSPAPPATSSESPAQCPTHVTRRARPRHPPFRVSRAVSVVIERELGDDSERQACGGQGLQDTHPPEP